MTIYNYFNEVFLNYKFEKIIFDIYAIEKVKFSYF